MAPRHHRPHRRLSPVALVAVGLLTAGLAAPGGAAAAPATDLRVARTIVERTDRPLGLDATAPRLSWELAATERGQRQTAYQIRVASSPALLAQGRADVWDTGKVTSDQSQLVPYAGPALAPRTRYFYAVRVWDRSGRPSQFSAPSWWETGLLDPARQWTARPIGHDAPLPLPTQFASQQDPSQLPAGRTQGQSFTTDRPITSVTMTAPTWYETDSDFTLALYRGGPGGELVARRRIENHPDNAAATLTFDATQPAGTYYLEQSESSGRVGWWGSPTDGYPHGQAYVDGAPAGGDRTIRWETSVSAPDGLTPQLRREFTVTKPVARARLYATALGVYAGHLNGQRIGDHELAPGWTDYRTRVQYQTYDVTSLLRTGGNAIGVTVSPGWYAGHIAIFGPGQYGDRPFFAGQLEIAYTDGSSERLVTDESWRSSTGPVVTSDLLMGEVYDARRETPGWQRAGFDDAGWQPVLVGDRAALKLVAQVDPPVRVTQELKAVKVTEPAPGRYVFDLGQNMVGTVRLRVAGAPAGRTVTLRHAEVLNPDGTIYTDNLRSAKATDHYTTRGGDAEVYQPRHTFHGFRYVEVTGYPGRPGLDAVTGQVMNTDSRTTMAFETDVAMLNQLQRNITWGQRGNFVSIPTDTPARDERMGWTGDINVFAGTAAYNMDTSTFLTKWLYDLRDAQLPDGAFPDVAPRVGFIGGGAAGWGDAGVTVPWTLYERYGDRQVLAQSYPAMQRWITYLTEHSTNYLRPAAGYGDWLNVDDETPKDVIATAYFAYAAGRVADVARVLGKLDDAARYDELTRAVTDAFVAAYVTGDGRIKGDTQTAYVLALSFDLLPDGARKAAADRLVALIEARGWHLSTGFLGTPLLLPVLTATGHTDVAYRLLHQRSYPSWGYQIDRGATTMWERWNSINPDGSFADAAMNSFNHYAYGSVGEWMYQNIAGIVPGEPGFAHTVVRPRPGGEVTQANARYDSGYGAVATRWQRSGDRFTLAVTVPVNTTAEVWVPARDADAVTESGRPAGTSPGVRFDRMADGYAVFTVVSGSYRFTAGA